MAIEFRCVHCQKQLRVADDAAGKKARCPDCGTIQAVQTGPNLLNTTPAQPADFNPFSIASQSPTPTPNPFAEVSSQFNPLGPTAAGNPYVPPQSAGHRTPSSREAILSKVQVPATVMLVVSIVVLVTHGLYLAVAVFALLGRNGRVDEIIPVVIYGGMLLLIAFLTALGSFKMRRLESYGLSMMAAVLSLLPCGSCCMVTIPFGIWSLIVLSDPEVRDAFR